ncbi:MAG: response regulator [Candidatus Cloacimonetes bacterium 4572_65]|nr:MAG: response regulator [Candidatus Cloacimonetes bacterium 4572_65]
MQNDFRILWIDDEVQLLKPLVMFLEKKGYNVDVVSNGMDGIEKVNEINYDLILLDEMMPGLDGLETLERIKKIDGDIPVIMVTKSEAEGIMDLAIANQIADYLIKPINPNQIIMSIKKIFESTQIIQSQLGQQYSKFVGQLNGKLMMGPNYDEWYDIYKDICTWDLKIAEVEDSGLEQMHFLQKRDCNKEFIKYVEDNYYDWINTDDRPALSFDVISNHVAPLLEEKVPTYFIILDCMRLDQYMAIEPYIKELFNVDLQLYHSILPTATPYSRNSIFSGLLPIDIANRFPEYWNNSSDMDNSRNRNEHQLMDEHLKDLGFNLPNGTKYVKIFNLEEGNFVIRKIDTWVNEDLIVLVYNFLDLVAHHRSKDQILQEAIPDEKALRDFTKHWFLHSPFYEALKMISKQGANIVITTDHGSIRVNRASQVVGDKDTSLTVRYKEGKNLSSNNKHAIYLKNPADFGLPAKNIVDNYIFAKDDYYFVYPNSYHLYQKKYNGTFQHGGVSMQEMILPISIGRAKKR